MATRNKRQSVDTATTETVASPQQQRLKIKLNDISLVKPKTAKQKEFFDQYQQGSYFGALSGVAGTGKTYIAFL